MRGRRLAAVSCLLLLAAGGPQARAVVGTDAPHAIHAGLDARGRLVVSSTPGPGLTRFRPEVTGSVPQSPRFRGRVQSHCAQRWGHLISPAVAQTVIAPEIVLAVIEVESSCNPNAISPVGAVGLMQIMPATGARFGADNLLDPERNVRAGVRYLAWLHARFDGDLSLVLAAYNAGEGAVLRHGRRVPPFHETQAYVASVLRRYRALQRDGHGVVSQSFVSNL